MRDRLIELLYEAEGQVNNDIPSVEQIADYLLAHGVTVPCKGQPMKETELKPCPLHPCIGCIYFKVCGETNRTMPCEGRVTKSEKKKEKKR